MKAPSAKATSSASRKQRHRKPPMRPASNAALNVQNRRVLAQHYRAKYGVK